MLFWRQGCLLFFELGQKSEISENPPNGAVTGSKWIGARQQKIKQTLQIGRIIQKVTWSKIR